MASDPSPWLSFSTSQRLAPNDGSPYQFLAGTDHAETEALRLGHVGCHVIIPVQVTKVHIDATLS